MEGRAAAMSAWAPAAAVPSSSGRRPAAASPPPLPPRRLRRGRRALAAPVAALLPEHLDALAGGLSHLLTLAYEPVVLPCSALNCGDIVYRSSLDYAARGEARGLNPSGLALVGAALLYLVQRPGPLQGAIDTYIQAPLQRRASKAYAKEDFEIGRKLASGGFGTVYRGTTEQAAEEEGSGDEASAGGKREVIVKKATEFGEAEAWMNERMTRAAPKAAAEFITAFSDGAGQLGDSTWLVWAYEGDYTLADLMAKKEFPYNLEQSLFGRELNIPKGPERKAAILRLACQQLLECLEACHSVGIVHRDIKPQNCILSERDRKIKLIDFGAAADLRIGINYVPNQYLLDPRYAPPQQYIMSKQTPRAPPAPVAALLSPVLWQLNGPDRFDMYSVGMVLLQMAFPSLRQDNALVAFNKTLAERHAWDLRAWRRAMVAKGDKAFTEGFAVLDAGNGSGWELLCSLIQYEPTARLSATAALAHPWFGVATPGAVLSTTAAALGKVVSSVTESVDDGWLESRMSGNGTRERGGFTEAYLTEEGLYEEAHKGQDELPERLAKASNTIAWWQGRQADQQARLNQRRGANGASPNSKSGSKPAAKPAAGLPTKNGKPAAGLAGLAALAGKNGKSGSGKSGSGSGGSGSSGGEAPQNGKPAPAKKAAKKGAAQKLLDLLPVARK